MSDLKAMRFEKISSASTENDLDSPVDFTLHCRSCAGGVPRPEENIALFISPETHHIQDMNKKLQNCLIELDRQIPTVHSSFSVSSRPAARLDLSSNPFFMKKRALASNNQSL